MAGKLLMEIFELAEMAELLGMPLTKARNWTIGRPLSIPASIRTATGTGSRNLYSIEDVYLMGLANEFSKAGFAAKAIGRVLEAVDANPLAQMDWLTVWRPREFKYHLPGGRGQAPERALVRGTPQDGESGSGKGRTVVGLRA